MVASSVISLVDVEVSDLVGVLVDSDHAEPVTEGVSLEVLLGEVLEVSEKVEIETKGKWKDSLPLGEWNLRDDRDFGLSDLNLDVVGGQMSGLSVDLDLLVQEGFLKAIRTY